MDIHFNKVIIDISRWYDAVNDFSFVLHAGTERPSRSPNLIRLYLFEEINNRYKFSLGIIPKDTGTFRFDIEGSHGIYRKKKPCPTADFYFQIVQTDQHAYLYPGGDTVVNAGPDYFFYVK